jgi:ADP-heptose:LPS heptosyltransferase
MHIAELTKRLDWGGLILNPGAYWVEDHNAAEVLWAGRGDGSILLSAETPPEPLALEDSKEITVVRVGGFGDLLWLNAIYSAIRERYPHLKIKHACFPRYSSVLLGFVDQVLPYPFLDPKSPSAYETTWWLENIIEGKACLNGEHPTDRIARHFGIEPPARKAAYEVSAKESKTALKRWKRTGRPRVCVQLESSTNSKGYPHIGTVMAMLGSMGVEIVTVGDPGATAGKVPVNVYHCPGKNLSIRESIAMASHCDVILGADSVMIHVGAALDIPVVGLFGPFDGATYMTGQRGTALQGRLKCSPCSWHPRGTHFPPTGPCQKTGHCNALAEVLPQDVVNAVLRLMPQRAV